MNWVSATCGLFGVAFGFLFAAAGLNQYDVIHQMLLLEYLDPFLIMGSAMATALPILWALERRRWHTPLGGPLSLRRWAIESKHVKGSMVFGTGWAISGACPGTAATTLGSGSLMGFVLVVGMVAGIALRDATVSRSHPAGVGPMTESATP